MAVDLETPFRSLLSALGLDLYDVELVKGTLNVVVTKAGGVDLESLTKANRTISEWLDANDPIAEPVHPRRLEPRPREETSHARPLPLDRGRSGDAARAARRRTYAAP